MVMQTKTSKSQKLFLYGLHACKAALENPNRKIHRIFCSPNKSTLLSLFPPKVPVQNVSPQEFTQLLGKDAVHQGIALEVSSLEDMNIHELEYDNSSQQTVMILDQVTDPHNVGAILRSCAAFGVKALIMQDRHSPPETGVLAKSASGALELVPIIKISNLSQAIKTLQGFGFWSVGFAESGTTPLFSVDLKGKVALVMGAEGDGMRRLTQENCDFTAYLPTSEAFSTLNVSNAAAIALYETFKQQQK